MGEKGWQNISHPPMLGRWGKIKDIFRIYKAFWLSDKFRTIAVIDILTLIKAANVTPYQLRHELKWIWMPFINFGVKVNQILIYFFTATSIKFKSGSRKYTDLRSPAPPVRDTEPRIIGIPQLLR